LIAAISAPIAGMKIIFFQNILNLSLKIFFLGKFYDSYGKRAIILLISMFIFMIACLTIILLPRKNYDITN